VNHYSQFAEDTWLAEHLQHITDGLYVDVGAHHPVIDSVTYAFYEAGWHGVTIEPDHTHFADHRELRPRDHLVTSAISYQAGQVTYYRVPGSGLSTTVESFVPRIHEHGFQTEAIYVPGERLDAILDEYVGLEQSIHFMSIDVEGSEPDVLRTLGEYRPWFIVIEAVEPLTRRMNRNRWRGYLPNDYQHVHYDGVNDFWELS
jgi:FkbM family methyltransferase